MAESILEILLRTRKTGDGDKQAAAGIKKLSDNFKELTGFNLSAVTALGLAGGAIAGAAQMARQAVDEYSAYVESVDKLAMSTGLSADETSRLIQVADDWRVSQEQLTKSMQLMTQNGMQPTIENLATLADEYLAMGSQTERAKYLQTLFGRSWKDMIPILERGGGALREATTAVSDGLVVTAEAVEANRKYQESVDNLADSWTAVKYAILQDFLPALASAMDELATSTAMQQEGASRNEVMEAALRRRAAVTYDWADAEREAARAQQVTNEATRASMVVTEQVTAAMVAAEPGMQAYADRYNAIAAAAEASAARAQEMADVTAALVEAQGDLQSAQEDWSQGVGSDVARLLQDAGMEGDEYRAALGAIDETMGTNLGTTEDLKNKQQELVDKFASGESTLEEFKEGLKALTAEFMPLNETILEAQANVDLLQAKLDALDGRVVRAVVVVEEVDSVTPKDKPSGYTGNTEEERADGGPVVAGREYLVGEEGPELFVPKQNGTIVPNGVSAGTTVNVYATVNSAMDVEEIAWRIAQRVG